MYLKNSLMRQTNFTCKFILIKEKGALELTYLVP